MTPTLGLLSLLALAPCDVPTASRAVLLLDAPPHVVLHAELLEGAGRNERAIALTPARSAQAVLDDERPGGGAPPTDGSSSGAAATTTSTPDAAPAAAAEEEPDIELLRTRERMIRTHRILGFTTFASLVVTEIAGTFLAVNQRTAFGPGNCNVPTPDGSNPCLLGNFGAGPLDAFHEISAFITVGLYAATGIFGVAAPDPEHASRGHDRRASNIGWHRALAFIHLGGMILLPILGVLSYEPGLVGLSVDPNNPAASAQTLSDYQSAMRTIHLGVGYLTLAALTGAMLTETVF